MPRMILVAATGVLVAMLPTAGADTVQQAQYIATDPWNSPYAGTYVDCIEHEFVGGPNIGGACFDIPAGWLEATLRISDANGWDVNGHYTIWDVDNTRFIGRFCAGATILLPPDAERLEVRVWNPLFPQAGTTSSNGVAWNMDNCLNHGSPAIPSRGLIRVEYA